MEPGAALPGANVSIRNEATGLELTAVTDDSGAYTIRNITGGTYTLRATLHGLQGVRPDGHPVIAGGIVRVNGRLEVGALTESVTVTTEAAVLKTDKADVSVDLRPEDVANLPLNQYRNYQTLMNLVPGATPPVVSERADRHAGPRAHDQRQRHQAQQQHDPDRRRRQHQRLAAAPRRVHRAGRDDRERQHLDQQLRCGAGHDGRRGDGGRDQVGHQHLQGLGVLLPQPGRVQRPPRVLRPEQARCEHRHHGRNRRRPDPAQPPVLLRGWERNDERKSRFDTYTVPTAKMRDGDFSEVLAFNPAFRIYDPTTGNPDGTGRTVFPDAVIPADRISDIAQEIQALYPAPNNAGTNNGLQNNLFVAAAARRPSATTTTPR